MDPLELCDQLVYADSESAVVELLRKAGYWDLPEAWRPYGDLENNYGTIGNQQSEAVAALVEKVVNAIDARLTNRCLERSEDPESPDSPQSVREAVHRYFDEGGTFDPDRSGRLSNWPDRRLNTEGDLITVTATGARPERVRGSGVAYPCITISDQGEGQTPDEFPNTFLSLHRNNKIRTNFVQGKFNMGATGALPFCSERYNLQLIVSRRNPRLLGKGGPPRGSEWGFTVVRRLEPDENSRSSVFEYLAPLDDGQPRSGSVLSFAADSYRIFPSNQGPYSRDSEFGSLVKLYEYRWQGTKSSIIMPGDGGGLIRRIEMALAEPALPIKLYELRGYTSNEVFRGVRGILHDLDRRPDQLERGFPKSIDLGLGDNQVKLTVYAAKQGFLKTHRTSRHGVLFLSNGQVHAAHSTRFFHRQNVRKAYLADDLMVVVDCSSILRRDFEELFMNSRDRLRAESKLATDIGQKLENFLLHDEALRTLENERRSHAIAERYDDASLREDLLKEILSGNPEISRYLLEGATLTSRGRGTQIDIKGVFEGRQFPTFFRPARHEVNVGVGNKAQMQFETDAENNYFDRSISPGNWTIVDGQGNSWITHWDRHGPVDGMARFYWDTGTLPPAFLSPGLSFEFTVAVDDESRVEALSSTVKVNIIEPRESQGGDGSRRRGGSEGVDPPNVIQVYREEWEGHSAGVFDGKTAVRIVLDSTAPDSRPAWDFFVNVDNNSIHEYALRKEQPLETTRNAFLTAVVFVGLAVIRGAADDSGSDRNRNGHHRRNDDMDVECDVERVTRYIAPVLLPVIEALGISSTAEHPVAQQPALLPA